MKIALFAYSRRGCGTALRVRDCFPEDEIQAFTMEKYCTGDFLPIQKEHYGALFRQCDALIFVGACGIAVRQIAPYVRSKLTDPAILCLDELAQFVIPLLSGHIGGANELALTLAEKLGAVPVVTTATDVNHRFSVDAWAAKNGFLLDDMKLAKAVSAAILERDVPIACDFPVVGYYPAGTYPADTGELGICIGWKKKNPFSENLHLIPQVLHLGLGCRKGTSKETIAEAVAQVLEAEGIQPKAIKCAASIDLKAEEPGLLAYCAEKHLPIAFYSAEQLQQVEGEFSQSGFVKQIAGVDCVCERAAKLGADRLIVKKKASNGVTVAIAAENCEVCFG